MKLKLEDIIRAADVQIRTSLHRETVEHYMDVLDNLPPVQVVKTKDGYILADGFHRVAAAERLERVSIEAEVKSGTARDAQILAATANTKHGRPLTQDERHAAILRLHTFKYGDSAKIARVLGTSETTVKRHVAAESMRRTVGHVADLPITTLTRLVAAQPEQREALARAADKRDWDRDDVTLAVANLKDPKLTREHKDKLLAGRIDPIHLNGNGKVAMSVVAVEKEVKRQEQSSALLAYLDAVQSVSRLRRFKAENVVADFDARAFRCYEEELDAWDECAASIRRAAKAASKLKAVV